MVVPCGGGASLYVGRLGRVGGDCPMWGWGFSVCGQTGEGGPTDGDGRPMWGWGFSVCGQTGEGGR